MRGSKLVVLAVFLVPSAVGCSGSETDKAVDASPEQGGDADDASPTAEISLIMDASGSMGELLGDETRYDVANAAFDDLLDSLGEDTVMGLVIMSGGCFSSPIGTEPTPLAPEVVDTYRQAVDGMNVSPGVNIPGAPATPVGDTLAATVGTFSETATARTVILISDGEEGCNNPPCDVANDLIDQGIDVKVEAVGFQISDVGAEQLQCVAEATGGSYYDIQDSDELRAALIEAAKSDSGFPWWLILLALFVGAAVLAGGWQFARSR